MNAFFGNENQSIVLLYPIHMYIQSEFKLFGSFDSKPGSFETEVTSAPGDQSLFSWKSSFDQIFNLKNERFATKT